MIKILAIILISTTSFAKLNESKVDYLIDLLKVEEKFPQIVLAASTYGIQENPTLIFVKNEYVNLIKKQNNWQDSKKVMINYFLKNFTEKEVNQLIAIHEMPVMEKISKHLIVANSFIEKNIVMVTKKQGPDEFRILMKKAIKLKGRKEALIKKLRARSKN